MQLFLALNLHFFDIIFFQSTYLFHAHVLHILFRFSLVWKGQKRVQIEPRGRTWAGKHSSEIWGLCLMKLSSETLQKLPYFWNEKTQIGFFFISSNFGFVTVQIQSFSKWKTKKNYLFGFPYSTNMANFEAFHWTISSSINLLFLKSEQARGMRPLGQ